MSFRQITSGLGPDQADTFPRAGRAGQQQASGGMPKNFMRHYYDVYCLLNDASVLAFIGTAAYKQHKQDRFPAADNQVCRAVTNQASGAPAFC